MGYRGCGEEPVTREHVVIRYREPHWKYTAWSERYPGSGHSEAEGVSTRTWFGAWWLCWWRGVFTGTETWIEYEEGNSDE